jgi:hypothetical protein
VVYFHGNRCRAEICRTSPGSLRLTRLAKQDFIISHTFDLSLHLGLVIGVILKFAFIQFFSAEVFYVESVYRLPVTYMVSMYLFKLRYFNHIETVSFALFHLCSFGFQKLEFAWSYMVIISQARINILLQWCRISHVTKSFQKEWFTPKSSARNKFQDLWVLCSHLIVV